MHLQPLRLTLGLSLALSLAMSSPTCVSGLLAPLTQHTPVQAPAKLELRGEALAHQQRAEQLASTSRLADAKPLMGVGEARRRRSHRARAATINEKGAQLSTDEVLEASAEVADPERRGFHAYSGRGTYVSRDTLRRDWMVADTSSILAV